MQLSKRITQANSLLAPYAVPHLSSAEVRESLLRGRMIAEPEDATRFPFQRDRDRIIHATAFRRLKHKTQVFVSHFGDHYRTRLTHTLEVTQLSRDMARAMRLNEDLSECIALAHDLGHTPFGHAGEEALDECMQPYGKRFEHNEQSYRICTAIEERKPGIFGLNLNREVLDGLLKHATPHDKPHNDIPSLPHSPTLEAQVVNLADEIAYTVHDIDDGVRAGFFTLEEIVLLLPTGIKKNLKLTTMTGALMDYFVANVYAESHRLLVSMKSLNDVLRAKEPLIALPAEARALLDKLRAFLWQHMYLHSSVLEQAARGQSIIKTLFDQYIKNPPEPVQAIIGRTKVPTEDAVRDYIAGMTDNFAIGRSAELGSRNQVR